jgi:hypothetical protein
MGDCGWQQDGRLPESPCGHTRNPNTRAYATPVRKDIRIVNPVSDHSFTSRKRALRFIKQRRAEWVEHGVSIRFIDGHRKHVLAQQSANATRYWYERAVWSGFARYAELANLPMVAPAVALGIGKRKGASRHTFLSTQGF